MTASLFRKIPLWAKIVFPVGLVLFVLYLLMNRGGAARPWQTPSPPVGPGAPPSVSPEKAKELKEEVKEEAKTEREKVKEEADKAREDIDKWLSGSS